MRSIAQITANIDAWLETMRGPDGYGGPVVHWWQQCLSFTGAGLDWRYEGIISGYLTLWSRTGDQLWLAKARRAGDDLVKGLLPDGNFRNSSFELNPYAGGTPHEAAADLGLLRLAAALKTEDDPDWEAYASTAVRNLTEYYVNRLWDKEAQSFRDIADTPSLVPNKVCTLAEALFAWSEMFEDAQVVERYALPSLRAVIDMQVRDSSRLTGAIPQNRIKNGVVDAYFPYYVARCIPALLLAYQWTASEQWLSAARSAAFFVVRQMEETGHLPQVLYTRGMNRFPQWIAPLGDVLRILDLFRPLGISFDTEAMQAILLSGALPSGGIATAKGFAAQVSQKSRSSHLPDFRDLVSVTGWVDKAFAYLASHVPRGLPLPDAQDRDFQIDCLVRGKRALWRETASKMVLQSGGEGTLYQWDKGQSWASLVAPQVMWK